MRKEVKLGHSQNYEKKSQNYLIKRQNVDILSQNYERES